MSIWGPASSATCGGIRDVEGTFWGLEDFPVVSLPRLVPPQESGQKGGMLPKAHQGTLRKLDLYLKYSTISGV
jgi:hypothetical protein